MKLVLICYNEAIDDEIMEILDKAQVSGYTKWTKVLGKGQSSGPHLYSHIWPKANNVVAAVASEDIAATIFENVRVMRRNLGAEGVKAFSWQVDSVT